MHEFSVLKLLKGGYDIWHVHWPEVYLNDASWAKATLKSAGVIALVAVAHLLGTKVVWSVHNLQSHEHYHPKLEKAFWGVFTRLIHAAILVSETSRDALISKYPHLARRVTGPVPLGHFRGCYPRSKSRDQVRQALGVPLGATLLGFIGYIREYKNVPHLIRSFRQVHTEAFLLIAGQERNEALREEILNAAGEDPRIRLSLKFVPFDELGNLVEALDLLVLPYQRILNSAAILLGLSLNRPVFAPHSPALDELADEVGGGWLTQYDGDVTSAALATAIREVERRPAADRPNLSRREWKTIATQMLEAYRLTVQPTVTRARAATKI